MCCVQEMNTELVGQVLRSEELVNFNSESQIGSLQIASCNHMQFGLTVKWPFVGEAISLFGEDLLLCGSQTLKWLTLNDQRII